jgi:hypothetical protein
MLKEVFSPSPLVIKCKSREPSFEDCDRESLSLARWTPEVYRSFLRAITPQVLPYLPTSTFPLSPPKIKVIKVQSCSTKSYPFFHFFKTPAPIKTGNSSAPDPNPDQRDQNQDQDPFLHPPQIQAIPRPITSFQSSSCRPPLLELASPSSLQRTSQSLLPCRSQWASALWL